jgi:hypothetical protein
MIRWGLVKMNAENVLEGIFNQHIGDLGKGVEFGRGPCTVKVFHHFFLFQGEEMFLPSFQAAFAHFPFHPSTKRFVVQGQVENWGHDMAMQL